MSKHSVVHWSMPRDSKKRDEVAAEQAIARYGTAGAAVEATGIPLDVLAAAEARINESGAT